MSTEYDIIYCIGDSHISFFSGRNEIQPAWPLSAHDAIPSFKTYRLRAVLAYRLPDFGSTMQGREKLLEILGIIPKQSRLLLSFGEVDCRVHLIKQSEKQGRPIEEVVNECVGRYFSQVLELKKEFRPMVWAVVPSSPTEKVLDPRYPHYGTPAERNRVHRLFNQELERLCKENSIPFISIFNILTHPDGTTNTAFYSDQIHLSQRALPYAVRELQEVVPDLRIRFWKNGLLEKLPVGIKWILMRIRSEAMALGYFLRHKGWNFLKLLVDTTIGLDRFRGWRDTVRRTIQPSYSSRSGNTTLE